MMMIVTYVAYKKMDVHLTKESTYTIQHVLKHQFRVNYEE